MPIKQPAMIGISAEHRAVLKKLQAMLTGHVGHVLTYGETIILAERIVRESLTPEPLEPVSTNAREPKPDPVTIVIDASELVS